MKLILELGVQPPYRWMKGDWPPDDRDCLWAMVHWESTDEDIQADNRGHRFYRGPSIEQLTELFTSFIPDDSFVYARLKTPWKDELKVILEDLRAGGFRFEIHGKTLKQNWRDRLFPFLWRLGPKVIFAEANKRLVSQFFEKSGYWVLRTYYFLVCRSPLEGWLGELDHLHHRGVTRHCFRSRPVISKLP